MEPTARTVNIRAIVMYSLVGLVILGSVVGGIMLAKSRSQQYAMNQAAPDSKPADTATPSTATPSTPPVSNNESHVQGDSESHAPSAATTGPTQVPATGAEEWVLTILAIVVTAFMATYYAQSRHQLAASR